MREGARKWDHGVLIALSVVVLLTIASTAGCPLISSCVDVLGEEKKRDYLRFNSSKAREGGRELTSNLWGEISIVCLTSQYKCEVF